MMNKKGYVLQVTLIAFLAILSSLSLVCATVVENNRAINRAYRANEQRLIMLAIIGYYKYQVDLDDVMDDEFTTDDYEVITYVSETGATYYITGEVATDDYQYSFSFEIDYTDNIIRNFVFT